MPFPWMIRGGECLGRYWVGAGLMVLVVVVVVGLALGFGFGLALAAALLEEVIEQQCRTISVEAGSSSVQRRLQSPAETKAQLYALNRPRRLVNQPLERGARSFSRPLP